MSTVLDIGCEWLCVTSRWRERCENGYDETILGLRVCHVHYRYVIKRIELAIFNNEEVQQLARSTINYLDAEARAKDRADKERRKRQSEVVYFVTRDGFIKIGYSSELPSRMGAIARGGQMPEGMTVGPVKLLATLPGGRPKEGYLHDRFGEWRIPGTEWFYPASELLGFIEGLRGYIPKSLEGFRALAGDA